MALLLLLSCLAVGVLLLVRTEGRRDEFAMCFALGAARWRLARAVVLEGAILAASGAIAAVPVTAWIFAATRQFELPGGLSVEILELSLDLRAVAAAMGGALVAVAILSLIATSFVYSVGILEALRAGSHLTRPYRASRARSALVVGQVAVVLVLLAGTGLFIRSIHNALSVNAGYETSQLVFANVSLSPSNNTRDAAAGFFSELERRLRNNPDISEVTVALAGPAMAAGGELLIDGVPLRLPSPLSTSGIDSTYFAAMRTPLVAGVGDVPGTGEVIVSEGLARRMAIAGNPIGQRVGPLPALGLSDEAIVVGVAPQIIRSVNDLEPLSLFLPAAELLRLTTGASRTVFARAAEDPDAAAVAIGTVVAEIDDSATIRTMATIDEQLMSQMGSQRFGMTVLGGLGAIALLLAVIGVYVLAETTAAGRRREMGIRAALGARGWQLGMVVLRESTWLVGLGILAGLVLAYLSAEMVRSFLFQIGPLDPLTLASVAGVLLAFAILAGLRPAVVASRLDIARTLREK